MTGYRPPIYDEAERNEDGDLVVVKESRNEVVDDTVNLSKLFAPGKRRTNSEKMLKFEAKRKADPDEKTPPNPAFPVTPELGEKIAEWCDKNGLEPAWLDGPVERDDL
jgi:hypothetical protein